MIPVQKGCCALGGHTDIFHFLYANPSHKLPPLRPTASNLEIQHHPQSACYLPLPCSSREGSSQTGKDAPRFPFLKWGIRELSDAASPPWAGGALGFPQHLLGLPQPPASVPLGASGFLVKDEIRVTLKIYSHLIS